MLSGTEYQKEIEKVYQEYGDKFGGVFVWEYFNSNPIVWLDTVATIIKKDYNRGLIQSCNII